MAVIDSQEAKLPVYVSKPTETKSGMPGVIIIHDWWGLGNYVRETADQFASSGYVAIAPDLYSGKYAKDPDEARELSSAIDPAVAKKLLDITDVYLRALDVSRVGITGFCFGGTLAFQYLCDSREIKAAVIFYASNLPSDDRLKEITAPLLIIYGDKDRSVPLERVQQLEQTLKTLGKDARLLIYPDAPHAFFNNDSKQNYRSDAAKDAWEKTVEFFNERLLQDWIS